MNAPNLFVDQQCVLKLHERTLAALVLAILILFLDVSLECVLLEKDFEMPWYISVQLHVFTPSSTVPFLEPNTSCKERNVLPVILLGVESPHVSMMGYLAAFSFKCPPLNKSFGLHQYFPLFSTEVITRGLDTSIANLAYTCQKVASMSPVS